MTTPEPTLMITGLIQMSVFAGGIVAGMLATLLLHKLFTSPAEWIDIKKKHLPMTNMCYVVVRMFV